MNNKKLSIRPELKLSSNIADEDFQNKTLRPILKLQHDIILLLFTSFCKKQKIKIIEIKKEEFLRSVQTIIKKNTVLRNQSIGLVLGQFTTDEFNIYIKKNSEFNKRILNMIGQRIADNQSEIKQTNKQQEK